jgi:hypothetical protein
MRTWLWDYNPAKIHDVNRGPFWSPIGFGHGKRSPIYAPISQVLNSGSFCQTDDFTEPPKTGRILKIWTVLGITVMEVSNALKRPIGGFYGCAE